MLAPTLSLEELADELGRSADWLYVHWQHLARTERLPRPLHAKPPYAWSRAQIYAWLDRDLTQDQRFAAAAYRAALEAASLALSDRRYGAEAAAVEEWRAKLDARFVNRKAAP